LLECEYNTKDRSDFTLVSVFKTFLKLFNLKKLFKKNGYSRTDEETCSAFLFYYPRIDGFDFCSSPFAFESLFEFYHDLMSKSLMPHIELNEDEETLSEIETTIRYKMPLSNRIKTEFEEYFKSSYPKMATCGVLI
jgi:hypothetical protein